MSVEAEREKMRSVFLFVIVLLITSCSADSEKEFEFVSVDSSKSVCFGVSQQACLRVFSGEGGNFSLFYGNIEGFSFKWGYSYDIVVRQTEVQSPPADGSTVKSQLMRVESSEEDPVGTRYVYSNVDLLDFTILFQENSYQFLFNRFICADDVDCEALLALNNSGGQVNLVFQYIGNSEIQLVGWQ